MSYILEKPYSEKEKIEFIVKYNHNKGLRIEETEIALYALEVNEIMVDDIPQIDPEYETKEAEKKKKEIQELYMTRSDFFDGMIKAFGLGSEELLIVIQNILETQTIDSTEKKVAINNYKNALNFYRKHPLFSMLSNIDINFNEKIVVKFTEEQWDNFFVATNKKNPEAYKELLPNN